jgi:alkane 1-monooxygenase
MNPTISRGAPRIAMHRHIAFCFLPQMLFVLLALGTYYRGYWLLLPVLFLLVVVPLLDTLTGWQDDAHFSKNDFSRLDTFLLHWNTRLYAVFYLTAVICILRFLHHFTIAERGFLLVTSGLLGAIAFSAVHELLHGREKLDQVLQRITTAFLFYPHYKLIHTQSHHAHVATADDKNTAWLDESIYAYILRTIPESMMQCWRMESTRINNRQLSPWSGIFKNRMFANALGQVGVLLGVDLFSGMGGLLFYLGHIIVAHVMLESVNYIQHYGLLRKRDGGEYEMTAAEHSWDSYHYFSSYASFRVGHHSFHHISAKPYYLLSPETKAPKLPVGYFWAIAMVLIPPWWRQVINPRRDHLTAAQCQEVRQ